MKDIISFGLPEDDPFHGRHPREAFGAVLISMSLLCDAVMASDAVTVAEADIAALIKEAIYQHFMSTLD
jgi:hypothetical protein